MSRAQLQLVGFLALSALAVAFASAYRAHSHQLSIIFVTLGAVGWGMRRTALPSWAQWLWLALSTAFVALWLAHSS
jgi:hypothetical protein